MAQWSGFDYTSPYYYLVTLKAKAGLEPFSILTEENERGIKSNLVTRKMNAVIFWMNKTAYPRRMRISNFVIMPNHLHLIIKIEECEKRPSLFEIVNKLMSTLTNAYYDALNLPREGCIFEEQWHDWIVYQAGILSVFTDYVMKNPRRWIERKKHAQNCLPVTYETPHMTWTCIGALSVKETPIRAPIICSRSITPESELWQRWRGFAQRLGPGTLAIGTFMSPCEKMVREEVLKAGGGIVHLIPRGISPKGHATEAEDRLLIEGRLTIMTPFPYETRSLTAKALHERCHTTLHPIARSLQRGIGTLPPSQ